MENNSQEKMVSGTAWLSGANIVSRLLGAVYIIPWYAWMAPHSAEANALFSMGYNIYAFFILLSTVGIPAAISKEISRYHALDDEETANRLLRQVLLFMLLIGVVAAIVMYVFSPAMSYASGGGANLIPVMRSLSLSILFIPVVATIRGYFQGLNQMKAFAVSQIYEQIVRIIWMLTAVFMIMKVSSGYKDWVSAVTQSTTAAFIGVIASLIALVYYLVKEKRLFKIFDFTPGKTKISTGRLLKQTLITSIPFLVTGSAIQLFKLVDQMTFVNLMLKFTTYSQTQLNVFFAYFAANVDKITMIVIAIALTLGDVGLPLITAAYTKRKRKETAGLVAYNFQLFAAFMIPAVIGMALLAKPLYTVFYGVPDSMQLNLFVLYIFQSIILTLPILIWIYMQAMQNSRSAMKYFLISFVAKLLLQVPSLYLFHVYGPFVSSSLALLLGTLVSIRRIRQISGYNPKNVWHKTLGILLITGVMGISVIVMNLILSLFLKSTGMITSFINVLISGGLGIYVYLFLSAKLGLLEKILGAQGTSIRRRLHI
ncbi:MAG TPA: polysaccharide biosynthesis protein [Lactovum miscens]|uniref:putative polysaccharide biosynthesis protein n=1 Tax=Lactovum miscens TaxID=190387 RepID=UPI002ED84BED